MIELDLQSEIIVVKPTDESLEIELSETVVEPNDKKVLNEDEDVVTKSNQEVSKEEHAAIVIQAAMRGFLVCSFPSMIFCVFIFPPLPMFLAHDLLIWNGEAQDET